MNRMIFAPPLKQRLVSGAPMGSTMSSDIVVVPLRYDMLPLLPHAKSTTTRNAPHSRSEGLAAGFLHASAHPGNTFPEQANLGGATFRSLWERKTETVALGFPNRCSYQRGNSKQQRQFHVYFTKRRWHLFENT